MQKRKSSSTTCTRAKTRKKWLIQCPS